jgi:hypothetical protein
MVSKKLRMISSSSYIPDYPFAKLIVDMADK